MSAEEIAEEGPCVEVISDTKFAIETLKSKSFDVVDYDARYAQLEARLNVSFSNIREAFKHIPPCVTKERHPASRAEVAGCIAARKTIVSQTLPKMVAEAFSVLHRPGDHELMSDAIVPLTRALLSSVSGIDVDTLPADGLISDIFSQSIGISKRKKMDDGYARLFASLTAQYPDETPEARGARLALVILGHDAMIGTIGYSLLSLLSHNFIPMAKLAFEHEPQRTGVPYVDRQAITGTSIAGRSWNAGDIARVELEIFEGVEGDRNKFFGAGSHTCLGRSLFLQTWSEIAKFINSAPGSIALVDWTPAKNDVFRYPETLKIRVE